MFAENRADMCRSDLFTRAWQSTLLAKNRIEKLFPSDSFTLMRNQIRSSGLALILRFGNRRCSQRIVPLRFCLTKRVENVI